ncbi:MAG: hypothetical protein KDK54_22755 [Leptospiraceae bacterium]|nr:hypothetical protein [Leptospiraceae bacterium]
MIVSSNSIRSNFLFDVDPEVAFNKAIELGPKLEAFELTYSKTTEVSEKVLSNFIRECPNCKFLDLSGLRNLKRDDLKQIVNNTALEILVLRGHWFINDAWLELFESHQNLRKVDLQKCVLIKNLTPSASLFWD